VNNSSSAKPYVYAIDVLRVIAILAVVLIHTTSRVLEASHYNLPAFPVTLFLNQISRFAVPLFFMISGFVLELNYEHELGYWDYLKKRFSRIFVPYIFWSAIYYLFVYTLHSQNFLQTLVSGNASYQLYFIPALLIFYLAFPLFHKLFKILSNFWVLILLGIVEIVLLHRDYNFQYFTTFIPLSVAVFNYFIFILGMVASHYQEQILKLAAKWKYWLTGATILSAVYVFWQGRSKYLITYNYQAFYSQWRPSVLLYTLLVFGLFFYVFTYLKTTSLVKTLSKLSFFVFFIHIIFLEKIWLYFGQYFYTRPGFDILFFGLVAGLSFAAAYLVHKIPLFSKFTG
jgi:surface polysaccharide O-acyltransferase-like enzyme